MTTTAPRAAQREASELGHQDLAPHLGRVLGAHLDEALDLRGLDSW
ncbi:hypothetical protein [Streptomyces sp. NPDC059262]